MPKDTDIYAKITHYLYVKQKNVFLLVYNVYNKQRLIAARFSTSKLKQRVDIDYILNKKNDKRFNNRGYLLFFSMDNFLKHLWLIPNILKWQDCKGFTELVPSQTPSKTGDVL